mmetsp:Transcript_16722/g.36178  ORF Transcript_16722/g.36178 Transcript_16722/m.36178 type:complete len:80 (+) Transcript_16722:92-331(+)
MSCYYLSQPATFHNRKRNRKRYFVLTAASCCLYRLYPSTSLPCLYCLYCLRLPCCRLICTHPQHSLHGVPGIVAPVVQP